MYPSTIRERDILTNPAVALLKDEQSATDIWQVFGRIRLDNIK